MANIPFLLRARLNSPNVFPSKSFLTLDLFLTESCKLLGEDFTRLSLQQTKDVWHASAGILVGDIVSLEVKDISRMTLNVTSNNRTFRRPVNRSSGLLQRIGTSYYTIHHANRIIWFGLGDPDKVLSLMERLDGIGDCRNAGFGKINEMSLFELKHDYSFKLPDGTPGRPIPLYLCSDIDINESCCVIDTVAYKPNYSDFKCSDLCVIPTTRQITDELVSSLITNRKAA